MKNRFESDIPPYFLRDQAEGLRSLLPATSSRNNLVMVANFIKSHHFNLLIDSLVLETSKHIQTGVLLGLSEKHEQTFQSKFLKFKDIQKILNSKSDNELRPLHEAFYTRVPHQLLHSPNITAEIVHPEASLFEQLKTYPGLLLIPFEPKESTPTFCNNLDFKDLIIVTDAKEDSIQKAYLFIKQLSLTQKPHRVRLITLYNIAPLSNIVASNLMATAERFLDVKIDSLGSVNFDSYWEFSEATSRPIHSIFPQSEAAQNLSKVSFALYTESFCGHDH